MSTAARRSTMGAFAAAALVVVTASLAWACQPPESGGMTNAQTWFCRNGVRYCSFADRVGVTNPKANTTASYYNMLGASGAVMSPNHSFTLRWVTGNHSGLTAATCYSTTGSATFKQTNGADAIFTTGTTGTWAGKGPVSMPNAAGSYTICANPTIPGTAGMAVHYYPFIVI